MRNPTTLVKDSVSLLQNNYKLLLGIAVIPIVLQYLVDLVGASVENPILGEQIAFGLLFLAVTIVSFFAAIALTLAVDNTHLTISEAYEKAQVFFWRYIGMWFVLMITLGIAFLLLVIPGVILSVWFTFAVYVLVLENEKIIASIKKSREYVRGRWWAVFGRLAAGFLMVLLVMMVAFIPLIWLNEVASNLIGTVLNIFLLPLGAAYIYFMYQDVKKESGIKNQE